MNGKQYVGKNASSFESYKQENPVTGVRLIVDDENKYVSGDMNGNVWELTCPYGTQEMADNILSGLAGKTYKGFEAENAVLDPSAELGDGITVNGLYSVLAYRKVEFGPGHMSTISAPGDNEPDEEYKYTPQKDREVNRKLAQTRSLIEKSAEEIRLAIEATDGRVSELKVTLDGVTVTDESGTTRIKGSSIETGSIAAGAIRADQITLTGAITWGDLDSGVQSDINNRGISASRARTIITEELVSSPNIAGGVFWNLKQNNCMIMTGPTSGGIGDVGCFRLITAGPKDDLENATPYFSIYNSRIGHTALMCYGATFIRTQTVDGITTYPCGYWDFSDADSVTGLYLRFSA